MNVIIPSSVTVLQHESEFHLAGIPQYVTLSRRSFRKQIWNSLTI